MKKIVFAFICLFSCTNKPTDKYGQLILGEWKFAKIIKSAKKKNPGDFSIDLPRSIKSAYEFLPHNICENKLGYYKEIQGKEFDDRTVLFLGTTTSYKTDADNLWILNPADSNWVSTEIVSITYDTLTLQYPDSTISKFVKMHYKTDNRELFDRVIVCGSGCFGTCPISSTIISKNGEVLFSGEHFNTKNGFYSSKISATAYSKIEKLFKNADIEKLNEHYAASWTDDQEVTVSFIKNNRIVKTISDYGSQAPEELYYAYSAQQYMYQLIPLDSITALPEYMYISHMVFKTKKTAYYLLESQSFFLWYQLLHGTIVKKEFDACYTLEYLGRNTLKGINTDGRYYKFELFNGQTVEIDLGYNFFEENNIEHTSKSELETPNP